MTNKRAIRVKVPGKLMVAGEFAVLIPHHKLVVTAVNRFVYTYLEDSAENKLILEDFQLNLAWRLEADQLIIDTEDKRINFVKSAMEVVFTYLKENNIPVSNFSLLVKSELDDESGIKYGLGSSAAVVTAIVKILLKKFLPKNPADELIFKLASIAHVKTQGNGSGADIAASTYSGVLLYSSFQAEWLLDQYAKTESISNLVEKDWKYLSIERLNLPTNTVFCVGWTGTPASTENLVDKVLELRKKDANQFQKFLIKSDIAINKFLQGIEEDNIPLLFEGIKLNRQCLAEVGVNAQVNIETPLLGELSDLAERFGGAGKLSGAGGGDCGIAFMPSEQSAKELKNAWVAKGIKPLDLSVYIR